jgi:hypothetical protein
MKVTYEPDTPASESMVVASGIHSLALRAGIGSVRISLAEVIQAGRTFI